MKPDLRPISVLTVELLAAAEWWIINGNQWLDVRHRDILSITVAKRMLWESALSGYDMSDPTITCSPATVDIDGMPHAAPWPIMEGEEEIVEWRGCDGITADWYVDNKNCWVLQTTDPCGCCARNTSPIIDARPGFQPVQRKGGEWVWEKDA